MPYIYLDWVVLQHMKNGAVSDGVHGPDFLRRVAMLAVHYLFPISEAHIGELLSPNAAKRDYRAADIQLLKAVSRNTVVQIRNGVPQVTRTPLELLIDAVAAQPREQSPRSVFFAPFQASVDTAAIDKSHPFWKSLVVAGGSLNEELLQRMTLELITSIEEPASYKAFRQQVAKAPSVMRKGRPTVVGRRSEDFELILPVFDFLAARTAADVEARLVPAANALAKIGGAEWGAIPRDHQIEQAMGLLDFHPSFHDKTTSDNPPRNMQRDAEHFCFASDAAWFVTEDRGLISKARVVAKAFDLSVNVVSMREFLADGPVSGAGAVGQASSSE